ncbi:MAG: hypothetical protein CML65_11030 [Rhodobacteraceae bacterium]|nr:hypothetical protein [Paracoccaceae bacterium]
MRIALVQITSGDDPSSNLKAVIDALRDATARGADVVLAPAQTGTHPASTGRARNTYGHSMAVAARGEVPLDAGTEAGRHLVDLDLAAVDKVRRKIPSPANARDFAEPA